MHLPSLALGSCAGCRRNGAQDLGALDSQAEAGKLAMKRGIVPCTAPAGDGEMPAHCTVWKEGVAAHGPWHQLPLLSPHAPGCD